MKKLLATSLALCLLLGSVFVFSGCARRVKYDDADKYSTTEDGIIATEESIHSVEIYWDGTGVLVSGSFNSDKITAKETETDDPDKSLHYLVEAGVLKIYPCASGERLGDEPKGLSLELPMSLASSLQSLDIEVKGETKVFLQMIKPAKLSVNAEDGNVSFDGALTEARVETVKGNLTVKSNLPIVDLEFVSEIGNADITTHVYGFTAVMRNEKGSFTTDYAATQNGSIFTCGNPDATFVLDTEGQVALHDYKIFQ